MPIDVVQWRVRIGLFHSEGAYREMKRRCGRKHQKIKIKSLVGDVSFVVAVALLAVELIRAMMLHSITVLSCLQWRDVTEFFHTTLSSLHSQWQQQDDKHSVSRKSTRRSRPNLITDLPSLTAVCVVVLHSVVRMLLLLSGDVERNPGPQVILSVGDLPTLTNILGDAAPKWMTIGDHLGFTDGELKSIQSTGGDQSCFRELLAQWFKWAPPKHELPTLGKLASAVREAGEERLAYDLPQKYKEKKAVKDNPPQSPTLSTDGESPHGASATGNQMSQSPETAVKDGLPQSPTLSTGEESPHGGHSTIASATRNETSQSHDDGTDEELSLPYLDTSGLTPEQAEGLKGRLIDESRKIMLQFQNLVTTLKRSLEAQKVSVEDLTIHLSTLGAFSSVKPHKPVLDECLDKINEASNMIEVFWILRHYISFFNFDIIEHLVTGFGTEQDKDQLQQYKEMFQEYCKRRCIECPAPFSRTSSTGQVKMTVTLDVHFQSYRIEEMQVFKYRLSKILQVSEAALHLCHMKPKNSIDLVFQIPTFVAEETFPLSSEQESALVAEGVVKLVCGEYTKEWKVNPLSRPSTLLTPTAKKHERDYASQPLQPRPLPPWNAADSSRSNFWYNEWGNLYSENECMIIAMCDVSAPQVKAVKKGPIKPDISYEEGMHQDIEHVQELIRLSHNKELICTYSSFQSPRTFPSKTEYLQKIESFLMNCKKPGVHIWYTGDGQQDTGNWCFSDDVITFDEIWELYIAHFRGRKLAIVSDCCYSGHWAHRLAEILDSLEVPACGHKAREKGILLQVFCSCHPHELAYNTCFSTHGALIGNNTGTIWFPEEKLTPDLDQTTCYLNATRVCCFRTPEESCLFSNPQFPTDLQWSWKDILHPKEHPGSYTFCVRGMDRGRPAWRYVLVYKHLKEQFLAKVDSGTVDVADSGNIMNVTDYGHVLYSGWGKDPPEEIKKKIDNYHW